VLLGWAAFWFSAMNVNRNPSWHFAVDGGHLLFDGAPAGHPAGGLDLFANYPKYQSGPLTFVAAIPISWLGGRHGLLAAQLVMMALGLLILLAAERATLRLRPDIEAGRVRWTVLGAGAALIPMWALTAVWFAHFDDVLALAAASFALWAAAAGRAWLVGSSSPAPWTPNRGPPRSCRCCSRCLTAATGCGPAARRWR